MDGSGNKSAGLASGWILVTGLFALCLIGTSLTWWTYTSQVFSSSDGVLIAPIGGTPSVAVELPSRDVQAIRIGHGVIITIGKNTHAMKGRVVSIYPGKTTGNNTVIIQFVNVPSNSSELNSGDFPQGTRCSITIDTTVPPLDELKQPAGALQQ